MPTRVSEHPLSSERLARLRDRKSDPPTFRAALEDLTLFLLYEATAEFPTAALVSWRLHLARRRRPYL